jgi:hypothetical protein
VNSSSTDGQVNVQAFDGTTPDAGTTILTVGAGQTLTQDPGTPVIIMDADAPAANVTVEAGAGQDRVVVAGGGDDVIVATGGGNITVETGGGNDSVTTGAGTDQVAITGSGASSVSTGEGGDTIIISGSGSPTVDAGGGNDTIQLASDQGQATVDGGTGFDQASLDDARGNHKFTIQDGIVVLNSAPTTLKNVEMVQFGDGISVVADNSEKASVARLYEVMFDREADTGGLEHWFAKSDAGESLTDLANAMASSQEFYDKFSGKTNDEFVDSLYQSTFGREADADGKAHWLAQMSDGMTQADVARSFAQSQETVQLMGIDGTQYVIDVDNG